MSLFQPHMLVLHWLPSSCLADVLSPTPWRTVDWIQTTPSLLQQSLCPCLVPPWIGPLSGFWPVSRYSTECGDVLTHVLSQELYQRVPLSCLSCTWTGYHSFLGWVGKLTKDVGKPFVTYLTLKYIFSVMLRDP